MLCDMSLLLRPSLVGLLVNQPLSTILLKMAHLAIVMTSNGVLTLGDVFTATPASLLGPFAFALKIGSKGML